MIRALGKNITAKMVDSGTVRESGIHLIQTSADALALAVAEVINVGPNVVGVKPGDKIVYKPYADYRVKLKDEELVMFEEDDILGVVENE